jgi:hypothetical protein
MPIFQCEAPSAACSDQGGASSRAVRRERLDLIRLGFSWLASHHRLAAEQAADFRFQDVLPPVSELVEVFQ